MRILLDIIYSDHFRHEKWEFSNNVPIMGMYPYEDFLEQICNGSEVFWQDYLPTTVSVLG